MPIFEYRSVFAGVHYFFSPCFSDKVVKTKCYEFKSQGGHKPTVGLLSRILNLNIYLLGRNIYPRWLTTETGYGANTVYS